MSGAQEKLAKTGDHGRGGFDDLSSWNPAGGLQPATVTASTFAFSDSESVARHKQREAQGARSSSIEYGRYNNPTTDYCEARLAQLEGAEEALLYPAGMSAITSTLLGLLSSRSHVVIGNGFYRQSRIFCTEFLKKFGVETTVAPLDDLQAIEKSIRPETKLVFFESPTNPYLRLVDLEGLAAVARRYGLLSIVDSTLISSVNQRPVEFGVDLVIQSATKYICGHNDVIAGVVAGRRELVAPLRQQRGMLGNIASPRDAAKLLRSLETYELRVQRHNENGLAVAQHLQDHPLVERVWYPGLPSHPEHAVAAAQMRGFGGVVTFELKADYETTKRFIDAVAGGDIGDLTRPAIAASFGSTRSIIQQPAAMTFHGMSLEQLEAAGIKPNLIRFAAGIEDAGLIIRNLDEAFEKVFPMSLSPALARARRTPVFPAGMAAGQAIP